MNMTIKVGILRILDERLRYEIASNKNRVF
jgi:hypothetical protein